MNSVAPKKILVTGCAGFIGYHVAEKLLSRNHTVTGLDNLNDYYDVNLKKVRLARLQAQANFIFEFADLSDRETIENIFSKYQFDCVINLAAQAGVRYSIQNPQIYINSNIQGFLNILEGCRHSQVEHLVYASSSSVYGGQTKQPFNESDSADHPMALYAATKKANELMAHSYSSLYKLPTTGLRFFTVYGPWGRPDMALFLFIKNILLDKPINVFNSGNMVRDFTYIDDIVEGVARVVDRVPMPNPKWDSHHPDCATSYAPYRIYNIGNNNPTSLIDYIRALEKALGKKAKYNFLPIQAGDVLSTNADVTRLETEFGYRPTVLVEEGVRRFVEWYRDWYQADIPKNNGKKKTSVHDKNSNYLP
ncbi:MAG: capsular biosynthesis protein CpsI [Gammaproteobacteria bacterium RIFCSPHIGHO2_12_FULL_38_11]|nr:MAG: capsular biosynthesis protein CpsI [Gammaproteobacteria bacterium RIFCSPHIGHO2_12_FULL_38_11]